MPDMTMSVTISRTLLSLSPLEVNDHVDYYVGAATSPGPVQWQRESVSSQFVDGDVEVSARRGDVTENFIIEVLGTSAADAQTNLATLLAAIKQATFTITTTLNGASYAWACKRADYQVMWDGPRVVSNQYQVQLQVPRSPIPVSGPF